MILILVSVFDAVLDLLVDFPFSDANLEVVCEPGSDPGASPQGGRPGDPTGQAQWTVEESIPSNGATGRSQKS